MEHLPESTPELKGGCQCGHLRYQITGSPLTLYACHCRHCQLQSSSGFGLSAWVDAEQFTFSAGVAGFFTVSGDSGASKNCAFCPQCGTRIYHRGGGSPGRDSTGGGSTGRDSPEQLAANTRDRILSVKGGTLDAIHDYRPIAHIWTRSALPWILEMIGAATPALPCFDKEPADPDALTDLWQQAYSR